MRRRLEALFDADITLAAYHLALDAHPEIGNNALLAKQLGIEPKERFAGIGFGGPLRPPTEAQRFARRVSEKLGREPLVFPHGPETVRRAAVVTGRGGQYLPTPPWPATTCSSPARPRSRAPPRAGAGRPLRRRGALRD